MSGRELNTILIVMSYSTQKLKTQSGKLNISSSTQNTSCPRETMHLIYKKLIWPFCSTYHSEKNKRGDTDLDF